MTRLWNLASLTLLPALPMPGTGLEVKAFRSHVTAEDEAAAEERRNAAKDCAEERAADPDAFAENWGTNPNKRNAFGKCVSAEARS